jgi:hypothetical protein
MKDQKQIVVHLPDNALAQAAEAKDRHPSDGVHWRIDRTNKKRAGKAHRFETLADNPRPKRVQIEFDVRKLGHVLATSTGACRLSTDDRRLSTGRSVRVDHGLPPGGALRGAACAKRPGRCG